MKKMYLICGLLMPILFFATSCKEKINPNAEITTVESISIDQKELTFIKGVKRDVILNVTYNPNKSLNNVKPKCVVIGVQEALDVKFSDNYSSIIVKYNGMSMKSSEIFVTLQVGEKEVRSSECNVSMLNCRFCTFKINNNGKISNVSPLPESIVFENPGEEIAVGICNGKDEVLEGFEFDSEKKGDDIISAGQQSIGNINYLNVVAGGAGEKAEITFKAVYKSIEFKQTMQVSLLPQILGYIMLKDGTVVWRGNMTEQQKADAIGVVVYLYRNQSRVESAVRDKLGRPAKGLVLALKNAAENVAWCPRQVLVGEYAYPTVGKAYNHPNGYSITNKIIKKSPWGYTYPAFDAVDSYRSMVPAPSNTTGWYLPSIGEWLDIISQDGIGGVDITGFKNSEQTSLSVTAPYNVTTNIDKSLEQFDTGKVDFFYTPQYYWSASENDYICAYGLVFGSDDGGYYVKCGRYAKNGEYLYNNGDIVTKRLVRCILAF